MGICTEFSNEKSTTFGNAKKMNYFVQFMAVTAHILPDF